MSVEFNIPVVIVGAGQAGLALSYFLKTKEIAHIVLEKNTRVGDNWRHRWDTLRLFSPVKYNHLPGLKFPGRDWALPDKDEAADYLRQYARHHQLPVRTGIEVHSAEPVEDGWVLKTSDKTLRARILVVATGAYGTPHQPQIPGFRSSGIPSLHTSAYRNPGNVPRGKILVVGAGASGQQIARDLARTRKVWLAGPEVRNLPRKLLGIDIYWWLYRSGLMRKTRDTRRGQKMMLGGSRSESVTVGEDKRSIQRLGIQRVGNVVEFIEQQAKFEDGAISEDLDMVIWATGFRNDYTWIVGSITDERGEVDQYKGKSRRLPGLYFMGLHYQYRINSSLMGGVGADAELVADQVAEDLAE